MHKIATLRRGLAALKHATSDQSLYLMPEFQNRLAVLQRLQYIDEEETVLLKGRVEHDVSAVRERVKLNVGGVKFETRL